MYCGLIRFIYLQVPGIYHGNLVFGSQNPGEHVIDNAQLLQYVSFFCVRAIPSFSVQFYLILLFPLDIQQILWKVARPKSILYLYPSQ